MKLTNSIRLKTAQNLKIGIMTVMILFLLVLTAYFTFILDIHILYTHFYYIPIIIATYWWGRRGMTVPVFLAIYFVGIYGLKAPAGFDWLHLLDHVFRGFVFCFVGFVTAILVESMQEEQYRFKELFDNMGSGVAVYEAVDDGNDFVLRDFNKAGERIDQARKENLIGKSVVDNFPGIKDLGLFSVFQRVWQTGVSERHPATLYKDDRITGWRENFVYNLPSGEIIAVYDDVTERKRAEESLQDSEERLRNFMDSATDSFYLFDSKLTLIEINKAGMRMWPAGTKKEELIGKNMLELVPDIKKTGRYDKYMEVLKTGKPFFIDDVVPHPQFGTVQITVKAFKVSDDLGMVVTDITEHKKAEEALANAKDHLAEQVAERTRDLLEEKQRIETILETIPSGILALNSDGSLALTNRTFKALYQEIFQEEISDDFNIFEAPESYLLDEIRQLISAKEPKPQTIEPVKGLYLQLNTANIRLPDEHTLGVIVESRDVTPFIELDNLRKRFVSTVSHEFRTPITALDLAIRNLQKYREKLTEAQQAELIEMTAQNSSILIQMIEDLLIVSKIERGKLRLQWADYSPWEVLSAVSKQLDPNRQGKGIAFQLDVSPDIELLGDAKRIGQIFRILLENAIKYSNERSQIKIEAIDHYQGKYNPEAVDGTLIQVADSGMGIREKDLPHVFERFYLSDEAREIQGTGLGLAIAKEIILLHHGEIYADSEYGRGSTFSVFLSRMEEPPASKSN